MHHLDHPNCSLSHKPLGGDNYNHRQLSVEVSLVTKYKLGFVRGTCKRPEAGSVLGLQWDRCNSMMISWLLHSVLFEIEKSVEYCSTTTDICDELSQCFGQPNGAKVFQTQRELCQISQGSLSISASFTKLKKMWDEYSSMMQMPPCSCGSIKSLGEFLQNQRLMQFRMVLMTHIVWLGEYPNDETIPLCLSSVSAYSAGREAKGYWEYSYDPT